MAVTKRRTKHDYAQQMKYLVDERYPDAEWVTVVQDQLNTHDPSALYASFEPAEANACQTNSPCNEKHWLGSGAEILNCER